MRLLKKGLLPISLIFHLAAGWLLGLQIDLDRPGERQFVVDRAGLIDSDHEERIRRLCDQLLTDLATPIIVVTVESLSRYDRAGLRIETFATRLFDQWQIGHAELAGDEWNTGILLLVSLRDRKARIELGAGWGRGEDAQSRRIMDELILPRFKEGNYSAGILSGVEGLEKMARGLELPSPPQPWWTWVTPVLLIGLAVFTIISLIRRGAGGWAWLFWAAIFALAGAILYRALASSRSGGGGFSGGSFGGGFSGGGGATGSW